MKKGLLCLLILGIMSVLISCESEEEAIETAFYEKEVLSHLTDNIGLSERLPAFSENIAVIDHEEAYDEDLLTVGHAGLFCDDTNEVIYVKKPTEEMYPASLTKCMTALLVLENVKDLQTTVQVTDVKDYALTDGASMAGLQEGCFYTVKDLLFALMIPSGNDAANVLAQYVGGSVDQFVAMMNQRANELGMLNTHFMNPHGLHHKEQYTSIYDLYLLMHECLRYDVFCEVSGTEKPEITCMLPDGTSVKQSYQSTNSFLRRYTEPPAGLTLVCTKTGYTTQAKRNLILVVKDREGKRYISIVTQAETYDDLYLQMNALLTAIEQ